MMNSLHVYVDGSYGVGGGGIGIWNDKEDQSNYSIHVVGDALNSTRIEALAIRSALLLYCKAPKLYIYTDNDHCFRCLSTMKHTYRMNDWKTTKGHSIAELDIVLQCNYIVDHREDDGYQTRIVKVNAHSNVTGNEHADRLAYCGMLNIEALFGAMRITISMEGACNTVADITRNIEPDLKAAAMELGNGPPSISKEDEPQSIDDTSVHPNEDKSKIVHKNPYLVAKEDIICVFAVCSFCSQMICIDNIRTLKFDDNQHQNTVILTRCRACKHKKTSSKKQDHPDNASIAIGPNLLANSTIAMIVSGICKTMPVFATKHDGLLYMSSQEILGQYTEGFKIRSIDLYTRKLKDHLDSNFL